MTDRLKGKVALVTGASGGIGSAAVRLFAQEGAKVLAVDQNERVLRESAKGLDPAQVSCFAANVGDEKEVAAYTCAAVDRFGRLDVAVLNAGVFGELTPIENYSAELFDKVLSVNVRGAWLGMKAAMRQMQKVGGGSIVLTASIQGLCSIPFSTGYTTSKHAVVGMMRGAALEGTRHNIRVNTVNPGLTDTNMMGAIHQDLATLEVSAQKVMDDWAATVPMRRYGKPSEIANVILFLASDESSYCTGATFVADGGLLASWTRTPDW